MKVQPADRRRARAVSNEAEQIKTLEAELRNAVGRQEFAEALDIVEELEKLGPLKAPHLAVRGQCMLKMRRKQDAKTALLAAFELDPSFDAAVKLLDQNFPGWTRPPRPAVRPAPARPQVAPPPASTPPLSAAKPQGPPPVVVPYNPSGGGSSPSHGAIAPPRTTFASPASGHAGPIVAYATAAAEGPINWNYVAEDLERGKEDFGALIPEGS
jgi:hypothetical protein